MKSLLTSISVKNNEGYIFTLVHTHEGRYFITIKDAFGLNTGVADHLFITNFKVEVLSEINQLEPHLRDEAVGLILTEQFEALHNKAMQMSHQYTFDIQCKKDHGKIFVTLGGYGLRGGGFGNIIGAAAGLTQVGLGIVLTGMTGTWAPPIGAGLISSGINGTVYSVRTNENHMNSDEYLKRSFSSFASGAVSASISNRFETSDSTVHRMGISAASNAGGHIAGTIVDAGIRQDTTLLSTNISFQAIMVQIGSAAAGVATRKLAKKVGSLNINDFVNRNLISQGVNNDTAQVISQAAEGGIVGGVGAAVSKGASNLIQSKSISDGLMDAMLIGGSLGAANSAIVERLKIYQTNLRKMEEEELTAITFNNTQNSTCNPKTDSCPLPKTSSIRQPMLFKYNQIHQETDESTLQLDIEMTMRSHLKKMDNILNKINNKTAGDEDIKDLQNFRGYCEQLRANDILLNESHQNDIIKSIQMESLIRANQQIDAENRNNQPDDNQSIADNIAKENIKDSDNDHDPDQREDAYDKTFSTLSSDVEEVYEKILHELRQENKLLAEKALSLSRERSNSL